MRGGQVTLFVAIGLVLLLTVGLFYVVVTLNQQDLPDEDIQSTANTGVLANYLQSCLDTIVYDELSILGRQGGVRTFDQWPSAVVDDRQVAMGIVRNKGGGILPPAHAPPVYPAQGVGFDDVTDGLEGWQDGYFGDVLLPAPCSKESTNRPGSTFTCRYYPDNPPGTAGPSMQERLEDQVRQRVQGCANLRAFEEATGQDVARVGEPTVNITMTYDNMIATLRYPVELEGSTSTRFQEFTRRYRVRLLPVMQFSIDLAKRETRDITFNISGDYKEVPSWKPGFRVLRQRDVQFQPGSGNIAADTLDMITVIDTRSVIEGQSFSLSFLVEDRRPMLDDIGQAEWEQIESQGFAQDIGWDPDDGPLDGELDYDLDAQPDLDRVSVTDADSNTDLQEQ